MNPRPVVSLSWLDAHIAATVGAIRRLEAIYRHRHQAGDWKGFRETTWSQDIEAAAAERAVAKWLGFDWSPTLRPHGTAPDVGNVHVRHTEYELGKLPLHDHDPDDAIFVLVTGKVPDFTIAGWITGAAGKRRAGNAKTALSPTGMPAFWIDQADLYKPGEMVIGAKA